MLLFIAFVTTVAIGTGEKVIALITRKNHFIGHPPTLDGIARALEVKPGDRRVDHIIVEFVPKREMYLIRFDNSNFLCGHYEYNDPAVILCKNENEPFTWWSIEKSADKKFALKAKGGKCLRPVAKDKREISKGYFLHLKKCNGKKDYIWDIQRVVCDPDDKDRPEQDSESEVEQIKRPTTQTAKEHPESAPTSKDTRELARNEKDSKKALEFSDIHLNDKLKMMQPQGSIPDIQRELAKHFEMNIPRYIIGWCVDPLKQNQSYEDFNLDKILNVFQRPKRTLRKKK